MVSDSRTVYERIDSTAIIKRLDCSCTRNSDRMDAVEIGYVVIPGAVWNIRMIGFGLGTFIFGVMTWAILDELPGWHTSISLVLAAAIIMLQFANLK